MARVTKPCPSCKGTTYPRDVDGVCSECERLIRYAKRKHAEEQADADMIDVETKEVHYAIPYYGTAHASVPSNVRDPLTKAMHALIMTTSHSGGSQGGPLVPEYPKGKEHYGIHEWKTYRRMKRTTAEAVNALDKALRDVLEFVDADAYENGRNLLMQIASGSISMNELNEKHTEKKT
jgi:hypothetical protein